MNLYTVDAGQFKLDGGAMFGVVPKKIWNTINPADAQNLCTWDMRCLLIEKEGRLILIDTGLGKKQSPKFFSHYEPSDLDALPKSLRNLGVDPDDITDVVLTHLHFDHCGGAVEQNPLSGALSPAFKNATYWTHSQHFNHALHSNPREKASFLSENIVPLQEHEQLRFVDKSSPIIAGLRFITVNGHTEKMILPVMEYKQRTLVYCADLIPSVGHLPVNFVMSYDIRPLESMKEKHAFLTEAVQNQYVLCFEHDPIHEACTVKLNERGKFVADETFRLSSI